ncbi:erythromycin esterase family protein [Bacteroides sp. 519]|uniref:erythromycin esterase family protein n=1 Tax=Bacteroides sp. 519 TaxID=2302937 RepID=UPI0013D0C455|nr:erythromycin esterase family protein [Bacteroides sp. 519]NDV57630.1 hypothetical protein [Bacteroides sp. 519]
MNKKILLPILILSIGCIIFLASGSFFQSKENIEDKFNFSFRYAEGEDFKWRLTALSSELQIDSSDIVNNKYPLCLTVAPFNNQSDTRPHNLTVAFNQMFEIEKKYNKDSIRIILNSKSINLTQSLLNVIKFDCEFNVIQTIEKDIKHEEWKNDTVLLSLNNTQFIQIGILALGDYAITEKRKFSLDRMEVQIGNCDLSEIKIKEKKLKLSDKNIIPLDTVNLFSNISVPPDKKIIALGETIHGNGSISRFQVEFIKKMVKENNCKLVLFESCMYTTLLLDLYIHGIIPEEKISDLKLDLSPSTVGDPEILTELFKWLKDYNQGKTKTVHIAGNHNGWYNILKSPLFDYVYAFYNNNTSKHLRPLLVLLNNRENTENYNNILAYMDTHKQELINIMGEKNFEIFHYAVLKNTPLTPSTTTEELYHELNSRDFSMFNNSMKFINTWLSEEESAVVVAHLGHTNKKYVMRGVIPYVFSMGYYFEKQFGEAYYNIGITAGEGEITAPLPRESVRRIVHMKKPVQNSFEDVCSSKQLPWLCFYPPANKPLITKVRLIGNIYTPTETYAEINLTTLTDAFIFIKRSEGYKNMNEVAKGDSLLFQIEKVHERNEIIKSFGSK